MILIGGYLIFAQAFRIPPSSGPVFLWTFGYYLTHIRPMQTFKVHSPGYCLDGGVQEYAVTSHLSMTPDHLRVSNKATS